MIQGQGKITLFGLIYPSTCKYAICIYHSRESRGETQIHFPVQFKKRKTSKTHSFEAYEVYSIKIVGKKMTRIVDTRQNRNER